MLANMSFGLEFSRANRIRKKVRDPKISKASQLQHQPTYTSEPADTMDIDATETKVQIRLTTRDASLQISEEPNILLVQTCK